MKRQVNEKQNNAEHTILFKLCALCLGGIGLLYPLTIRAQTHGSDYGYVAAQFIGRNAQTGSSIFAMSVNLNDGWKTYWLKPGAFGIPPELILSTQKNVKSIKLYAPWPKDIKEGENIALGYDKTPTFIVEIWPEDKQKTVIADASLSFGVCKTLCLPAKADVSFLDFKINQADIDMTQTFARYNIPLFQEWPDDLELSYLPPSDTEEKSDWVLNTKSTSLKIEDAFLITDGVSNARSKRNRDGTFIWHVDQPQKEKSDTKENNLDTFVFYRTSQGMFFSQPNKRGQNDD